MGHLEGKTALVTGAATGMGRATAERFAREGAKCVLFGLGGRLLDETASICGGVAVHGDVANESNVLQAVEACGSRLDVVVNAAGIILLDDPLTITNANWDKTFAVNVTGSMLVCRAALPKMIASGGGAIVNLTSVAAFDGGAGMASYSASKAALVSYTRSIAYAHGIDGVRANTLAPGWVRTPMSEMEMDLAARENGTSREAEFAARANRIALGRIAEPAEIAACALFLASPESSFVTGSTLVADGGGRPPVRHRAV